MSVLPSVSVNPFTESRALRELAVSPADVAAIVTLTLAGFVATNIDNLLLLVALLATSRSRWPVLAGYGAATTTVLALCLVGAALGSLIRPDWVGFLGIVPVIMGLQLGWRGWRQRHTQQASPPAPARGAAGAAFLLTLSNSGDSIALFLPLLAETERESVMLLLALYLGLVLAWAWFARFVAARRLLAATLALHSRWLLPCVMIAAGGYVLLDTTTDTLK